MRYFVITVLMFGLFIFLFTSCKTQDVRIHRVIETARLQPEPEQIAQAFGDYRELVWVEYN